MPHMSKRVSSNKMAAWEILFKALSWRLAKNSCSTKVDNGRSGCDAKTVCFNDNRRAASILRSCTNKYTGEPEIKFTFENGGEKPNETPRGCGEGIGDHKKKMGNFFFRADEKYLEVRQTRTLAKRGNIGCAKQGRNGVGVNSGRLSSFFSVCWKWCILGWPMLIREEKKSGLFRQKCEKSYTLARRILALKKDQSRRSERLSWHWTNSIGNLVQRFKDDGSQKINQEDMFIWSRLCGKKFIGKSIVYNLTIHPVHTYFANQYLFHNF